MTALDLDASWNLVIGDALRVLMDLPTGCADAVVTDPPYSYATGSLVVPVKQSDKHHITGKPTDLMRELVRIAPRGGLIVDPFAGSGTTGVAAVEQGRRFLGVEKTVEYAEISRARIEHAASSPTLFELPTITETERPSALFELEPDTHDDTT